MNNESNCSVILSSTTGKTQTISDKSKIPSRAFFSTPHPFSPLHTPSQTYSDQRCIFNTYVNLTRKLPDQSMYILCPPCRATRRQLHRFGKPPDFTLADSTFFLSHFSPNPNLSQMAFRSSFNRAFLLDEPQNSIYEFKTEQMQPENV